MNVIKQLKIGVYGSWRNGCIPNETLDWAYGLGKAIANRKHVLVTGGSSGVALECRRGCKESGGTNIGVIPESHLPIEERKRSLIDIAVPTGLGALGRMPVLTNTVHFAFAIGGGAGTLTEIILTYLQRKPVIVITGLQREYDPDVIRYITVSEVLKLGNNIEIKYGFLDSKSKDMVAPVYFIDKNTLPDEALKSGLYIYNNLGIEWDTPPDEGPLNE